MFDTHEFRVMLTKALTDAASSHKMYGYDPTLVDTLQKIAVDVSGQTEPDIEASAETLPIEMRSAKIIAETAAAIAQGAGRLYIQREDVEAAIELKFCTVYPFCKPK